MKKWKLLKNWGLGGPCHRRTAWPAGLHDRRARGSQGQKKKNSQKIPKIIQTPPPRTHRDNEAPCQSVGSPRSERLRMDAEGNYNRPMTVKSHHILQMHGPRHTSQAPHFHECTGSMRPRRFQHSPCKKQKAHAVRRQLSLSAGDEPPTVLSTRPGSLSSEQVRFRNLRHTHVI